MSVLTHNLDAAEAAVQSITHAKRVWILPILRVLDEMGGSGRPKDVKAAVHKLFEGQLSERQLAQLEKRARLGWTRLDMVHQGLLEGERGVWQITPLSQTYLDAHRDEPLDAPREFVGKTSGRREKAETESVEVTDFRAYDIPILQCLRTGRVAKKELLTQVHTIVVAGLLEGDIRPMSSGERVTDYRTSWAISQLKAAGDITNPARGIWEITERGRDRLAAEEAAYDIADYQGYSHAMVVSAAPPPPPPGPSLDELAEILGRELFRKLSSRLQLDREPTPDITKGLTRNLIFYGPPGSGKTHTAKILAQALTGEEQPSADSRWRIVQFHPSYAYEDFICGLRPHIGKSELTYTISRGPFLEICDQAKEEPEKFFVLIIDEINRGDPARIFGELMYALEYRGEEIQLPHDIRLIVPPNLILLGTMNSVDRSVALVDYALRRRFGFLRIDADPNVLEELDVENSDVAAQVLSAFNGWLAKELDTDHTLGHSIFLNSAYHPFSDESFKDIWEFDVRPLVEEYFFGDGQRLAEAQQQWRNVVASGFQSLAQADDDSEA